MAVVQCAEPGLWDDTVQLGTTAFSWLVGCSCLSRLSTGVAKRVWSAFANMCFCPYQCRIFESKADSHIVMLVSAAECRILFLASHMVLFASQICLMTVLAHCWHVPDSFEFKCSSVRAVATGNLDNHGMHIATQLGFALPPPSSTLLVLTLSPSPF